MCVYYLCIIEVLFCHNEIPLLGEEILLHYIVYMSISRIPVLIVSRCMRGHVASCCRKEGSMHKKKKVGRNGRHFHFTCIFEGYRFVAKCLSRADLTIFSLMTVAGLL